MPEGLIAQLAPQSTSGSWNQSHKMRQGNMPAEEEQGALQVIPEVEFLHHPLSERHGPALPQNIHHKPHSSMPNYSAVQSLYPPPPRYKEQKIPYKPQVAVTSTLNQPMFEAVPAEFVYDHDFDKNGALFYLGTMGYQTEWKNPDHERRQVRSFASSISKGRPSDIVGR